jgi:exopolysaccharide biosynthesis polyprenyl glycosylphosphotransferase
MTDMSTQEQAAEERRAARRPSPLPRRRFGRRATDRHGDVVLTEGPTSRVVLARDRLNRRALAAADVFGALGVVLVVLATEGRSVVQPALLLSPVLLVFALKLAGLYDRDAQVLRKTTLDEAPSMLQITGVYALVLSVLEQPLLGGTTTARGAVLLWLGTAMTLLTARALARSLARRHSPAERCLVIGEPESIRAVEAKFRSRALKATVVAGVPLDPESGVIPLSRQLRDLSALVADADVHRVIIAPPSTDGADTLELVRIAKALGVRVSVLPRLFEVVGSSVEFDDLGGLTMLGVRSFGLPRSSRWLKRGFDVLGSAGLIVLLSPLMAMIAILIRLDSRGPTLFRQTRVGQDGEPFEILKFRSMVVGAESMKDALREHNEADGLFKIQDDPRITAIGRLIRKTSLDELPQLFNVLRGEMSLVGPRPLVLDEDALVFGLDRSRLHLTPGMTGHWQILGSARIPMHEMVGIDYLYVANWSLWTDIKILLRTIPHVVGRGGM